MDADGHGLRFEAETSSVISCAFEVLNTLGHGLLEKPYENSLCVEFGLRGIPWTQQPRYDVVYKAVKVGEYVPDLIVYEFVVVAPRSSTGSPLTNSAKCSITSKSPAIPLA
jgi:GxxExxY protein